MVYYYVTKPLLLPKGTAYKVRLRFCRIHLKHGDVLYQGLYSSMVHSPSRDIQSALHLSMLTCTISPLLLAGFAACLVMQSKT